MKAMWWLVAVGGLAAWTCPKPAQQASADRPECAHTWTDTSNHGIVPTGSGWETIDVPEYNDCQHFIVADGATRAYTRSYFAIFAFHDPTPLRARVTRIPGSDVSTGVLVAYIYAQSAGYPDLSLKVGGNCLYLHYEKASWRLATVRPAIRASRDSVVCHAQDTLGVTEVPLHVRPQPTPAGLGEDDVPLVARWDWDPKGKQQIVGVRCDAQWCDVGGDYSHGAHPEWARSTSAHERRTTEVKGWSDEQYLSRCPSPTTCQPTALVGTVIPDSALDGATSYPTGTFVQVARIAVQVDPSAPEAANASNDATEYETKKGLSLTPERGRLNQVFLCNGAATDCFKSGSAPPCPTPGPDVDQPGQWWYRIVSAKGVPKEGCFARRLFAGAATTHVVGAARWRWLLKDETNWIRCIQGCCEVQQ